MLKICILAIIVGVACGQGVTYLEQWPRNNNNTLAGARGEAVSSDIGNGTCILQFPGPVYWFHCENCDIVPAASSSPAGTYVLAGPNKAFEATGTFTFVVNFMDEVYNASSVSITCDPSNTGAVSVYSFPNNMDQQHARSRVYDNTLNGASTVTITFPSAVQNFTVDHPNTFDGGPEIFVISNIQSWQKEVWFQFNYLTDWFSAAETTVSIEQVEASPEATARKRRNAHF